MKKRFNFLDPLVLLGVLIGVLFFEIFFTYVVPASAQPFVFFDPTDQVLKLDNRFPGGTFTRGRLAQLKASWRVNNAGWVSDIDYSKGPRDRPLVAIIGDSRIEAVQVDSANNVGGQLRRILGGKYEVYTFGISGSSLVQFLHMSRYVVSNFHPEVLVFSLSTSDLGPSLCKNSRNVGVLCLNYQPSGIEEAPIISSKPSQIRRLASRSSLVRYMFFNVGIRSNLLLHRNPQQATANEVPADDPVDIKQVEHEIELATTYVLDRIAEENPDRRVIFMIEGKTQGIYAGSSDGRAGRWEQKLLENLGRRRGFEFIDLMDRFQQRYELDRQIRFESKYDGHWNEIGHGVVAEAISQKLALEPTKSVGVTKLHCSTIEGIGGGGDPLEGTEVDPGEPC